MSSPTCPGQAPAGRIIRELRLENGDLDSSGTASDLAGLAAKRLSVANRFTSVRTLLLNHVCLAVRQTAAAASSSRMDVAVYQGDRVVNGSLRPGRLMSQAEDVPIRAGKGLNQAAFQLVSIPQVSVSGTVWIVVRFDEPRQAAMGVNPRPVMPAPGISGSAHAGIADGASEQWFSFDQVPGGTAGNFFGNRPVIRGLQVQSSPCGPAAVSVIGPTDIRTTELGDISSFEVTLATEPQFEVHLLAVSTDDGEGDITPRELLFTTANWHVAQQIRVQGQDDLSRDGDQPYQIELTSQSADACYDNISILPVDLENLDDDSASHFTLPHLPVGGGIRSVMLLSHVQGGAWEGEIRLRTGSAQSWVGPNVTDGAGNAIAAPGGDFAVVLSRGQLLKFVIEGDPALAETGYLEVQGLNGGNVNQPILNGSLLPPNAKLSPYYSKGTGASPEDIVGLPGGKLGRRFIFPAQFGAVGDTHFALAPFLVEDGFSITLTLRDQDGLLLETSTQDFFGQQSIAVSSSFPTVTPPLLGSVEITSEQAVFLAAWLSAADGQSNAISVAAGKSRLDPIILPR